jgi:RNA polymerase sigma-70 factor (ECF subfamily)
MSSSGFSHPGSTNHDQRWQKYLHGIQARESASLQALYDETSNILYGLAYRVLNDTADAEEVILDVYYQVWNSVGRFDSSRGTVWSWLMVMTRNRAIDRLRKSKVRRSRELSIEEPLEKASESPVPETQSIFLQERALVRQAMAALAAEQREAIELAFFSGLTHSEVAETLRIPLGTIKSRIRVGIQKLRETLPPDVWAARS